jgi:hypothetical protein
VLHYTEKRLIIAPACVLGNSKYNLHWADIFHTMQIVVTVKTGGRMFNHDASLKNLGFRLRGERLKRNDSQSVFAARVGVSVPTLRKMEAGDPTVMIGNWVSALDVLERVKDLNAVLAEPEDLFAKYDQNPSPRQRASKRTT